MRKRFALTVFILFCGIYFAAPCFAQYGREGRHEREAHACRHDVRKELNKAHRVIDHGIRTRQIDHKEAENLRRHLKRVEGDLHRYESDGRLSPRECNNMQNEVRNLYRHIKHDMND
jgi:hypothetical protein